MLPPQGAHLKINGGGIPLEGPKSCTHNLSYEKERPSMLNFYSGRCSSSYQVSKQNFKYQFNQWNGRILAGLWQDTHVQSYNTSWQIFSYYLFTGVPSNKHEQPEGVSYVLITCVPLALDTEPDILNKVFSNEWMNEWMDISSIHNRNWPGVTWWYLIKFPRKFPWHRCPEQRLSLENWKTFWCTYWWQLFLRWWVRNSGMWAQKLRHKEWESIGLGPLEAGSFWKLYGSSFISDRACFLLSLPKWSVTICVRVGSSVKINDWFKNMIHYALNPKVLITCD